MAVYRHYHKPDLFITFTCNLLWEEIQCCLTGYQTAASRFGVVVHVFRLKLKCLMIELLHRSFMVRLFCVNNVYVFQFATLCLQKCLEGLWVCHRIPEKRFTPCTYPNDVIRA